MHAEDRTLGVIFETTVRLLVPLFQRPYVWKQEKNWEPLWDSIKSVADRRLAGSHIRPHFLGSIVLEQLKTETGEVDSRLVIDGQQRLTTLQLAIAAIRDICGANNSENYHEAFKRLSENYVPSKKTPESTFKVWPTNADREHFRKAMTAGSLETLAEQYKVKVSTKDYGHLIPNCYKFFHSQVMDWIRDGGGKSLTDKFDILFNAIRQDLVLVVVDLGESDDPQLIFETLNALGTPLQPSDLVKNFLFHWAERQGAKTPDLYEQFWRPFDDEHSYWRSEIRQGRLKWHRIDLFLAHYITLLRKDVVSMTHLFGEFREYFTEDNVANAENHIRQLRKYADVYHGFDQYSRGSREGLFFYRLEALDTNMAIPVLLEVLQKPDSNGDRELFLDYLESYLVRRAVCCLTYKNYNRIFVDMIKYLDSTSFSSIELLNFLLARKGESAEWPTDGQFRKAFCEFPIYKRLKQARTRMVLEAIEGKMRDDKSENILIQDKLTIEHIMPQKWRRYWPMPDDAILEDEQRREEILHHFGNLTLVTQKLNPSLSNAPWTEKKVTLMENSALAMNRKLQDASNWNEETIVGRDLKMFKLAMKIWPRPSSEIESDEETEILPIVAKVNRNFESQVIPIRESYPTQVSLPRIKEKIRKPEIFDPLRNCITKDDLKPIFEKIISEITGFADDIEMYSTQKYIAFKSKGKLIGSLAPRRNSFDMSAHIIDKNGRLIEYETIRIESENDDYSDTLEKIFISYKNL